MSEQFSFLGNKCKAAIAAISLGVLLLLPASLGYGGTIVEQAFGQLELIPPNGEPEVGARTAYFTSRHIDASTAGDYRQQSHCAGRRRRRYYY
jgi:hypothetical protein